MTASLTERLRDNLHEAGFDIFHGPFAPSLYNDQLESEGLVESGTLSKLPEECTSANENLNANAKSQSQRNASRANSVSVSRCESGSHPDSDSDKPPQTFRKIDAYLIGNTRHLWPIFLEWLESKERQRLEENDDHGTNARGVDKESSTTRSTTTTSTTSSSSSTTTTSTTTTTTTTTTSTPMPLPLLRTITLEDPLDTYERTVLRSVVETSLDGMPCWHDVYCSSEWEDPSRMVSMARVASAAGFSYLDPHTHLSVHPVYGTWHSYRAVLLLERDDEGAGEDAWDEPTRRPELLPNPLTPRETLAAREAFDRALAVSTDATATADSPPGNDENRLSDELGLGLYETERRKNAVAASWIALRDSVSIGREGHRFGDHQLWYHYTKDPSCLLREIESRPFVEPPFRSADVGGAANEAAETAAAAIDTRGNAGRNE